MPVSSNRVDYKVSVGELQIDLSSDMVYKLALIAFQRKNKSSNMQFGSALWESA